MRKIADPDGAPWRVDVSWTDIRFWLQFSRLRATRRERRRARAHDRAEQEGGGAWFDAIGQIVAACDELIAVAAIIGAIVLAVLLFPWLLVLFVDLAELLAFPILAVGIVGWRAARRRPFTITAARGTDVVEEWTVVGVREARRVERLIADAIAAGGDPDTLFSEYSTRQ